MGMGSVSGGGKGGLWLVDARDEGNAFEWIRRPGVGLKLRGDELE